jgi:hypothetical protein
MPSASPATSPSAPSATPVPGAVTTFPPGLLWPTLGPTYPKAGPLGMLVVALARFALGVAVGALLKQSPWGRRWLPVLVVPGVLAGIAFFVWVIRSLM